MVVLRREVMIMPQCPVCGMEVDDLEEHKEEKHSDM